MCLQFCGFLCSLYSALPFLNWTLVIFICPLSLPKNCKPAFSLFFSLQKAYFIALEYLFSEKVLAGKWWKGFYKLLASLVFLCISSYLPDFLHFLLCTCWQLFCFDIFLDSFVDNFICLYALCNLFVQFAIWLTVWFA